MKNTLSENQKIFSLIASLFALLFICMAFSHMEGGGFHTVFSIVIALFQLIFVVIGLVVGIALCLAIMFGIFIAAAFCVNKDLGKEAFHKVLAALMAQIKYAVGAAASAKSWIKLPSIDAARIFCLLPGFANKGKADAQPTDFVKASKAIPAEVSSPQKMENTLEVFEARVRDMTQKTEYSLGEVSNTLKSLEERLSCTAKQGAEVEELNKNIQAAVERISALEQKLAQSTELPGQLAAFQDELRRYMETAQKANGAPGKSPRAKKSV